MYLKSSWTLYSCNHILLRTFYYKGISQSQNISYCCLLAVIVEYATLSSIFSFVLRTDAVGAMTSYVGPVSWLDAVFDRFETRWQITLLRNPQQKQRNELRANVATKVTIIRVVAFIAVDGHLPVVHITNDCTGVTMNWTVLYFTHYYHGLDWRVRNYIMHVHWYSMIVLFDLLIYCTNKVLMYMYTSC